MSMQPGNIGGGGAGTQQSLHEMQRLQQLQAQYRQQQQQGGSNMGNSMGSTQAMPQQPSFPTPGMVQQHMNPSSLATYQQHSQPINMMQQQQQQQHHGGNSTSAMNQMQFSNPGTSSSSGWASNSNGMMSQGLTPGSTMDASSGSSARLMAMAGIGGGMSSSAMTANGLGSSNFVSNANNMGGMGNSLTSGPNSSSTMQNMQVLLQRQQQHQQLGKQQQLGSSGQQGSLSSNFNSQQQGSLFTGNNPSKFQQQQQGSLGGVSGSSNMGMNSQNSGNSGNGQLSANMTPQQQQQYFLQQQLAAMQKQQGRNSLGGGPAGSSAMSVGQQQQGLSGSVTGSPISLSGGGAGGSVQNQNTANNQNLLQQRQQQLLQQMQQQQQLGGGQQTSSNGMGGFQQQQANSNSGLLQQMVSNFRQQQQQLQSDMTNKQVGSSSMGPMGTAGVPMGLMPSMPGLAPSQTRNNSITSSNIFANNQDHSQQQPNNLMSTGSPNPMGLSGLSSLTSDQRQRLQQQGLLNQTNNGTNFMTNSNSSTNAGGNINNHMYGMGGGNLGLNNNDVGGINGGIGEMPPSMAPSSVQGQTHHTNNIAFPANAGVDLDSLHNTPILASNGVPSNSNPNVAASSLMDQSISGGAAQSNVSGQNMTSGTGQQQQSRSFLDGRFAGGWQSNKDLPDRRRIIFNILDVIRQMRPDTSKMSSKLPPMAKSLEELLYRSAKSKEDYMDLSTLKKRLQTIAHGLEIHREGSGTNVLGIKRNDSGGSSQSLGMQLNDPSGQGTFNATGVNGGGPENNDISISNQTHNSSWSQSNNIGSGNMNVGNMNHMSGLTNSTQSMNPPQLLGNSSGLMGGMGRHDQVIGNNLVNDESMSHGNLGGSLMNQQMHQPKVPNQSGMWNNMTGLNSGNMDMLQKQQMSNEISQMNGAMNPPNNMGFSQQGMQHPGSSLLSQDSALGSSFSNQTSAGSNQLSNFPGEAGHSNSFLGAQQSQGQMSQSHLPRQMSETSWANDGNLDMHVGNVDGLADPVVAQKKRVVLQQQQRLLLLRHASKCTAGPSCPTKFCEQMVTLWKHMKTCRNKNCKTSHCFSSRCVLNHYRICKSNGRTATCEVCGPVMLKIKQQERDDGSGDPLAIGQDASALGSSISNNMQQPSVVSSLQSYSDQQDPAQDHISDIGNVDSLANQQKLKAQLDNLRLLQKKQEELLKQQERLEEQAQNVQDPNSPQAQQLQQQQLLLQQLQKRCQHQQMVLQQRLQMQTTSMNENQVQPLQPTSFPPAQAQPEQETVEENKDQPISEPQQVKPRGTLSEGKGKRIASKGKRGKTLGVRARQEKDEDSTKKRRTSATVTPKERAQKKGKLATKQAAMVQRATDASSQNDSESKSVTENADDENESVISSMTKDEIQKHLDSLDKKVVLSNRMVTHKCMPILQELLDDQFGWVFREAVDPVALCLPDYYDVVKSPMHLELVKKNLDNAVYSDMEIFARDTKLVFQNAILYNGENSEVGELAQCMLKSFEKSYTALVQGKEKPKDEDGPIPVPNDE